LPTNQHFASVGVSFAEAVHRRAAWREIHPSLNRIGGGHDVHNAKRVDVNNEEDQLYRDVHKNLALNRAFELDKELRPRDTKYSDEADTFFTQSRILRVGTDCSGIEAPLQALENLKVQYVHKFSCDNDKQVRQSIKANFNPEVVYDDITVRDNSKVSAVDLYIAGFPCQPFSTAGKQQGFDDVKGRGIIFFHILDYIQKKLPKVFILENVKGLVTLEKGRYLREILKALRGVVKAISLGQAAGDCEPAYEIHHTVMSTKDHGVPQHRARWYCVGFLKTKTRSSRSSCFSFPKALECPPIQLFLDARDDSGRSLTKEMLCGTAAENVQRAKKKICEKGGDPDTTPFIVDCDAASTRMAWYEGISPCITRSRYRGHWITSLQRRFTKNEMFRLQGMDPMEFKVVVPDTVMGQQIGNAMCVNVIERVLIKVLEAAGLAESGELIDR